MDPAYGAVRHPRGRGLSGKDLSDRFSSATTRDSHLSRGPRLPSGARSPGGTLPAPTGAPPSLTSARVSVTSEGIGSTLDRRGFRGVGGGWGRRRRGRGSTPDRTPSARPSDARGTCLKSEPPRALETRLEETRNLGFPESRRRRRSAARRLGSPPPPSQSLLTLPPARFNPSRFPLCLPGSRGNRVFFALLQP